VSGPLTVPVKPDIDDVIRFGLMVERARKSRNMKRAELTRLVAAVHRCSRSSVRNWERGACSPPPEVKAWLIDLFQLSEDDATWSAKELARIRRGEESEYV
jgi:transcriptional regulator with XRE-family HTH domain